MKYNKKHKYILLIFSILLLIVVSGDIYSVYSDHHQQKIPNPSLVQNDQIASSSASDFYALSSTERDNFLFTMNSDKNYQVVVNATDDGIQNHRELVWDDIDFWNHRGVALYAIGHCADAGAAFYHVLMRDPQNDIASSFMANIGKQCKQVTSSNI